MDFHIFVLVFTVLVSNIYAAPELNSVQIIACNKNPTLVFCQGSNYDADQQPDKGRCAEYRESYDKYCSDETVIAAVYDFCTEYCQSCADSSGSCTFKQEELKFCGNYLTDAQNICKGESIGIEYLQFCHDYSISCRYPLGLNGVQDVPTGQTSCRQEQNTFNAKCQKLNVAASDTDYCVTASTGCGWSLGPPPPASIDDLDPQFAPPPPIPGETTQSPEVALRQICKQNEARARVNCFQAIHVAPQHIEPCARYVRDCKPYYEDDEPLRRAASLFNSRVGVGKGAGISGIPYYPFNREGSVGWGRNLDVDFGTWGGGVARKKGVSDFWQRNTEAGGNWYEGRYGRTKEWGVPILPFVSGSAGTEVNVPINERNLGQPVTINKGRGIGNFWAHNKGASVDWMNGNVGISNPQWTVPIVGVGGGKQRQIGFPSLSTFANMGSIRGK